MYSQKLAESIQSMRERVRDPIRLAGLVGLEKRLKFQAVHQACFQCEEADFLLTWRPLPNEPEGDEEWVPCMGRCGKFMALPRDEDGGLVLPIFPSPFCTAMVTTGE